jgi:hypothetical protein
MSSAVSCVFGRFYNNLMCLMCLMCFMNLSHNFKSVIILSPITYPYTPGMEQVIIVIVDC